MGDELAKVIKDYANNELVNKSLSAGLDNLSITLTAIEEYRNCEVQRLEAKVFRQFISIKLFNINNKNRVNSSRIRTFKITYHRTIDLTIKLSLTFNDS